MANFKPARIERQNAESISDILARFVSANSLAPGLLRQAVFSAWDSVSGAAAYSTSKFLKDGVLYVTLSSSVVRSRLFFRCDDIIDGVNACLKADSTLAMLGIDAEIKSIKLK